MKEKHCPMDLCPPLGKAGLTHPICAGNLGRVLDILAADAAGFVETAWPDQNNDPTPVCTSASSFLRHETTTEGVWTKSEPARYIRVYRGKYMNTRSPPRVPPSQVSVMLRESTINQRATM